MSEPQSVAALGAAMAFFVARAFGLGVVSVCRTTPDPRPAPPDEPDPADWPVDHEYGDPVGREAN